MARSGWKSFPKAKNEEVAKAHLTRAASLLSEAMSHLNAVAFRSSYIIPQKEVEAASQMYAEVGCAERTYHNYLVGKPLDRKVGA